MASIPPQRLTVDKIVKDLLEPATTSFYQVSIQDPRQLDERGDTFSTYLNQQGLSTLFNARGLDPTHSLQDETYGSATEYVSSTKT